MKNRDNSDKAKTFLRISFSQVENQVRTFSRKTKMAIFRKDTENWKHFPDILSTITNSM